MKRIFFTGPVVKLSIAAAVLVGFGLTVWLMSGMPAPREADRVGPANGTFSIIKPHGWESQVVYGPLDHQYLTTLAVEPEKSVGKGQRLFVGLLRKPPDLEILKAAGMVPGQFQDRDALTSAAQLKHEFVWRAVFNRGDWYEIFLRLPREEDVPHSEWWPYLTSFKANPRPATEPAAPTAVTLPAVP